MKMPLPWHEECFKNAKTHYERELKIATEAIERLRKSFADLQFYEDQIQHAKVDGKDAFDRERYMKKKSPPPV